MLVAGFASISFVTARALRLRLGPAHDEDPPGANRTGLRNLEVAGYEMKAARSASRAGFGLAPMTVFTTSPFSNTLNAGIAVI